jgi:hypothetical protein
VAPPVRHRSDVARTFGCGTPLDDRSYLVGAVGTAVLTAPPRNAKAIALSCRQSDRVGANGLPSSPGASASRRAWMPCPDSPQEGLAGNRSSPGCDARSLGRTQGASISVDMGATEDGARGEERGPAAQTVFRQTLLGAASALRRFAHPGTSGRDSFRRCRVAEEEGVDSAWWLQVGEVRPCQATMRRLERLRVAG